MFTPQIPPKLDVAARHVEAASMLWALSGDPRAVHVLVMAADELISAYAKTLRQALPLDIDGLIRPEKIGVWLSAKRKAYNYFKHADRDSTKAYDGPDADQLNTLNELAILQCWVNLDHLGINCAEHAQWQARGTAILYPDIVRWDQLPKAAGVAALDLNTKDARTNLRRITLAAALNGKPALVRDLELGLSVSKNFPRA